jgi:hypothetical protein
MLYMDTMTVYANPVPFNFTDVTNDDFLMVIIFLLIIV